MNTSLLYSAGEQLMHLTKAAGATDVMVSLSFGIEKSVSVRNGELSHTAHAQSAHFSLTALIGAHSGSVEFSSFTSHDVELAAKRAVALARVATENPYRRLSTPDEWPCASHSLSQLDMLLDAYDHTAAPTLAELKERACTLDAIARSEPGIARSEETSSGYSRVIDVTLMSNGFSALQMRTYHNKWTSVVAEENGEMKTGSDHHAAFHFEDLRSDAECARRAGSYAVAQLGAKPIATGRMPVIFDNRISSSLLGSLVKGIDADHVYHKSTFLLEKLGGQIFHEGVIICEEPHLPRRMGSQYYDAEGVKSTPWTLVSDGVLTMWLTTIESGAKLGLPSTGHASGTSNLSLRPSGIARADMIRDIPRGLLVTELMGKGANIATGAYSTGVEGFLIENGVITRPVNKVTIAGNLLDMFGGLIPANDLSDRPSGSNAPSCFIPSMMVGGT